MNPEDVRLGDWKRILLGSTPAWFIVEVLLRAAVLYLVLLLVLRVLGKRLAGQVTILEMGVMITLGAIVSAPMQTADKGILIGILLLCCTLAFQRGVGAGGVASEKFELATQGDTVMLIKDSVLLLKALHQAGLSRHVIFAALRSKGICHLGEIKRVYLEGSGNYSIVRREVEVAGLCILIDDGGLGIHCPCSKNGYACEHCGWVVDEDRFLAPCPNCRSLQWASAVKG
ncbi:DUF421 domain-containing protein [Pendulispora brunnea]|uniref:DUF421 domain-containing protein n=1 Tax=Pendulispora brunnea TaxID=2905690 RepID=A0ABZ2KF89_9BACT